MKNQQYEKLFLIRKLMDSYRLEYNIQDEKWLGQKFDKLYEMPNDALKYLAKLRGVYHLKESTIDV